MNVVSLTGNLTADPVIRVTSGEKQTTVANMRIAVSRTNDYKQTDFIPVTVFGKSAEFCEKYLKKGSSVEVTGELQTGSYEKDGSKVYTWGVTASHIGFGKGKRDENRLENKPGTKEAETDADGFMSIPDGVEDEGLPFA